MPSLNLTDATLRSLRTDNRTDFWDLKLPSFGIRVGPRSKVFILKVNNTRKKLGTYPSLTLQDARKKAMTLKGDPSVAGPDMSFREAVDLFLATHCKSYKPRVRSEAERQLKRLAHLNARRLGTLTTHEIQSVIDHIGDTPSEANHLFKIARTFFRFCIRRRFIQHSPLAGLPIPNRELTRARVLSDEELQCIWNVCQARLSIDDTKCGFGAPVPEALKVPRHFASIVQLLTLTGQRRGEVAALRAHYLQGREAQGTSGRGKEQSPTRTEEGSSPSATTWTITLPAELTKNSRSHSFPIGPHTASILSAASYSAAPGSLLFPARGRASAPFNGWSKAKVALDTLSNVTNWTLHDLRRTYATRMAALGCPPHIIEKLLNHVSGQISGVAAVYNRHNYIEEARPWVVQYEQKLLALVGVAS